MFSPCPTFVNLFGDKGSLSRVNGKITVYGEDGKPKEMPTMKEPTEQQAMVDLYEDFFDCILTRGTPVASPDLAMEASKIAFGLDISIAQNRTVTAKDFV